MSPKFSIIVPHYDGVITDEVFIEGMDSIESQTFRDFEVLIYHDGPMSRPLPDMSNYTFNYTFKETNKRYNDWGHSLRDLGIKEATGEYIVHFNPDNILFPNALQDVDFWTDLDNNLFLKSVRGIVPEIVVCPIILHGRVVDSKPKELHGTFARITKSEYTYILTANPPVQYNVDCMQVVMTKRLWNKIGGWYNKMETSDGVILQEVCKDNYWVNTGSIMGLHR